MNNVKQYLGDRKAGRKKVIIPAAVLAVVLAAGILLITAVQAGHAADTVYKETTAERGSLTVGITESGAVNIGTTVQNFELDLSELVRSNTSSGNSGTDTMGMGGNIMGGMDSFSQIFGFVSGSHNQNQTASGSKLTVTQVLAGVGQQVRKGDVLYLLEEELVNEIRERLESDVEKANADLQAVYAEQKKSKLEAQYKYDTSVAYGSFASAQYEAAIGEWEAAIANKQASLAVAEQELNVYESRLSEAEEDYSAAVEMLERCEWGVSNIDKWQSTSQYIEYESMRTQAKSTANTLESEIEQLKSNNEKAKENITLLQSEVEKAEQELAQGKLSAGQNYALHTLAYNTSEETYDIALSYLEAEAAEQEEAYEDTKARLEEFQNTITDNAICAAYDGVITKVHLKEDGTVGTNDAVITMYNLEDVTMKVSVAEDDMKDIAEGSAANVLFTAYPDAPFEAEVTDISDAKTNTSGGIYYEVSITLKGEVSGLYQEMTGDVTFITKESKDVLYISNRAVIRSGGKSYVKVKEENGTIKTKEITTGFSDGIHVEIVEGLSEGDVVLIESRVSDS